MPTSGPGLKPFDPPSAAAPTAGPSENLVDRYQIPQGVFDEMCEAPGRLRAHWAYMVRALRSLGPSELQQRGEEALRILKENGVTYNVFNDPQGSDRLWDLDPIPVLITSREWVNIERGLNQRAELLDQILADIYGPQNIIRRRLVPPELIHLHPGFLRACHGMYDHAPRRLLLYAADLARGVNGAMWSIGDRTQVPSGAGYALENRIVLSRTLPSLYRDSNVHRLATFFRIMRQTLASLAPFDRDNPRVVLLTSGPGNETFFEHAYLANYLGYALVQGADLTVRDRRVWLKTLDGLQPVHVILRRLDDIFCDPLELRADSLLGTPGLVDAARAGNVVIANPLGSGVLQNPGLMAYMPRLVKEVLGEELMIPCAPTYWCGEPTQQSHVLANLARFVIKPISPHAGAPTLFGFRLTAAEREMLAKRIKRQPWLFVGQEHIALSTAPTLVEDRLEPRPMVLRTFVVARGDSFAVMPGSLARVGPTAEAVSISNQQGGVSKDTWVLASEPENPVTLLQPEERPVTLTRAGGEISSRLANNLFWLGRYAERTDGAARLLRQLLARLLSSETDPTDPGFKLLARIFHKSVEDSSSEKRTWKRDEVPPEPELMAMIIDRNRVGALAFDVAALVSAARSARDRLSDDTWRVITSLQEELDRPRTLSEVLESVEQVITILCAFAGLCAESMSRTQGWRFLDMGRRLERAIYTIQLLDAFCVPVLEQSGRIWELLLSITDSVMTYRRRYRGRYQAGAVLDLLLHDEGNPRSIGFQLVRLQDEIAALPSPTPVVRRTHEERIVLEAVTALRLTDMDSLVDINPSTHRRDTLHGLLCKIDNLLGALSDSIGLTYFDQVQQPQQLVEFL